MSCIKRMPSWISSKFTLHADTIVDSSLFLTSVTIWTLVLYYSVFNDEAASMLSFLGVASIIFTTKRCLGGAENISSRLPKVMALEFVLIVLGCSLLVFTYFSTTAFYLICLGMLLQKIRYDICLANDGSAGSPLTEVSQDNAHYEQVESTSESDKDEEVSQPLGNETAVSYSEDSESDSKSTDESASENEFTALPAPNAENEGISRANEIIASHTADSANDTESAKAIASNSFSDTKSERKSTDEFAFENEDASSRPPASKYEEVTYEFESKNGAIAIPRIADECEQLPENDTLEGINNTCYERPASKKVFHSAHSHIKCKYLAGMNECTGAISNGNRSNGSQFSTSAQNTPESSRSDVENIVNRIDTSFIYSVYL